MAKQNRITLGDVELVNLTFNLDFNSALSSHSRSFDAVVIFQQSQIWNRDFLYRTLLFATQDQNFEDPIDGVRCSYKE